MDKDVTALKIIANLKYSNKVDFGDCEHALELIKQYPVLYPYLPTELRYNKQIAVAFCQYSGKLYAEYLSRCDAPFYSRRLASEYDNRIWLDGKIDFGPLARDKDVLAVIGQNSLCRFLDFTDDTYDEKALGSVLGESPQFIVNAYAYWLSRIALDAKQTEHLRVKYELYNQPDATELTFYKCLELIQTYCTKSEASYFYLLSCRTQFSEHFGNDYVDVMRQMLRSLSVDLQKVLVQRYYFLAKFIRADDLDTDVAQTIADFCPIGAEILPDELLLRYRLTPRGLNEDEMRSACRSCGRCDFIRYFDEITYANHIQKEKYDE